MRVMVVLTACALPLAAQKTHDICNSCHGEHVADFRKHKHFQTGLSCDTCHGESEQHRNANGAVAPDRVSPPDQLPELCGGCHADQLKEYRTSKHARLVAERSKTRSAQCATCHGNHGPRGSKQIVMGCQRCHAQLSSSHPAVADTGTCITCHKRHTLLTAAGRR